MLFGIILYVASVIMRFMRYVVSCIDVYLFRTRASRYKLDARRNAAVPCISRCYHHHHLGREILATVTRRHVRNIVSSIAITRISVASRWRMQVARAAAWDASVSSYGLRRMNSKIAPTGVILITMKSLLNSLRITQLRIRQINKLSLFKEQ